MGEHPITHYLRSDSYHKGYKAITPNIELKRKVGDDTNLVALELNNPNESNKPDNYLKRLEAVNVSNLVRDDYDDIVDWLRAHYEQRANADKPKSQLGLAYDYATSNNPNYWLHKN